MACSPWTSSRQAASGPSRKHGRLRPPFALHRLDGGRELADMPLLVAGDVQDHVLELGISSPLPGDGKVEVGHLLLGLFIPPEVVDDPGVADDLVGLESRAAAHLGDDQAQLVGMVHLVDPDLDRLGAGVGPAPHDGVFVAEFPPRHGVGVDDILKAHRPLMPEGSLQEMPRVFRVRHRNILFHVASSETAVPQIIVILPGNEKAGAGLTRPAEVHPLNYPGG